MMIYQRIEKLAIIKQKAPAVTCGGFSLTMVLIPESNWGPHPYQGCALPTEPYQHFFSG